MNAAMQMMPMMMPHMGGMMPQMGMNGMMPQMGMNGMMPMMMPQMMGMMPMMMMCEMSCTMTATGMTCEMKPMPGMDQAMFMEACKRMMAMCDAGMPMMMGCGGMMMMGMAKA